MVRSFYWWVFLGTMLLLAAPPFAFSQEPPDMVFVPSRLEGRPWDEPVADSLVQSSLGLRTWVSSGHNSVSYAGDGGFPNILSELHWRRLNNPVIELSYDALWFERFALRLDLGVGTRGTGQLRDQDYDNDKRTDLASDTSHPVNADNLYYFNFDLGWRLVTWRGFRSAESFLAFDLLLGWQHWSEKMTAHGGVDLFPGVRDFPPGDVIASHFAWDSFRIGLRSQWQVNESLTFDGRVFFIPYTDFRNEDIHYLRDDLLQNPSFIDRAHGGIGVQADLSAIWHVTPRLGLELGYRVWELESGHGFSITRAVAADFISPFNGAKALRQGALVGVHWRF